MLFSRCNCSMEKTILVNLNVSNDSNFEADSGYIFQRLLWTHICEQQRNLRVLFLGHRLNTEQWHPNVTMVPFHHKYDKFSTRYHFDWHGLRNRFENLPKVDLLFNNQPELTMNLKTLFSSMYGGEVPAVTYYHYLPFHYDGDAIQWDPSQNVADFAAAPQTLGRNFEGLELSEKGFIGSAFGRGLMQKAYRQRYKESLPTDLEIFSPPLETELFSAENTPNGIPRILYNQRLYKHYGTECVIDAVCNVAKKRDIRFVITDPTGERSYERDRLDPHVKQFRERLTQMPFVDRMHCASRDAYHQLLTQVDLGIAPVKPSALWSMAVADLLACGKPVLCPNIGAFPELVPNNPELLFQPDGSDLEERIHKVLDDGANGKQSEQYRSNVRRYEAQAMAQKMYEQLSPILS